MGCGHDKCNLVFILVKGLSMLLSPRYICLAPHEECKSPSAPSPAAESAADTLDLSKIHYDDLAAAKAAHRAAKQAKLQGNTAEASAGSG